LNLAALRAFDNIQQSLDHLLLMFEPSPVFQGLPDLVTGHKRILIRAANRVGKTRHVAWVAAKSMVEIPGFRVRVIGPTANHIHNVLGKYLAEFLEPHLASGSYHVEGSGWNGGRARSIRLKNGSICDMRAISDKPEAHSGASFHMVIFDEPPTVEHFTENAARLVDTNGTMIVAATMVNRPVRWLREMVQGAEDDPGPGITEHGTGWLQVVAIFSRENCPWYSQEQYDEWMLTMDLTPWQKDQRIHARWDGVTAQRVLAGITERAFGHENPPGSVQLGLGMDHGDLAGHSTCVLVAFRGTQVWAIDEWRSTAANTPEENADDIAAMLDRHGIRLASIDLALGDIGHVRGFTGWKINEAMTARFAQLNGGPAPFEIRTPDKTPGSVDWGLRCLNYAGRRGDLRINKRCLHLAQGVRHWKGGRKGADGDLSHTLDALRYVTVGAIGHHKQYAALRFS
jgi:hypothetical protein